MQKKREEEDGLFALLPLVHKGDDLYRRRLQQQQQQQQKEEEEDKELQNNASLNRPRSREREGYHRERVGSDTTMRSDLFGKLHVRVVLLRGDAGKVLRAGNHRVRPRVRRIRRGRWDAQTRGRRRRGISGRRGLFCSDDARGFSLASARKKCQSEDVLQRVDHERVRGIWFAIV
tara:strand:+ start:12 stop:536 length:525 start_codon:yes stop_codon:yes gene_type:complete